MNTQGYTEILLTKQYPNTDVRETIHFSTTALEALHHVNVLRNDESNMCNIELVFTRRLDDDNFVMVTTDKDIKDMPIEDLEPEDFDSLMKMMNCWLNGLRNASFEQVLDGVNGFYRLGIGFMCKSSNYSDGPQVSIRYNRDLII